MSVLQEKVMFMYRSVGGKGIAKGAPLETIISSLEPPPEIS